MAFLQAAVRGDDFFPLQIRFRKARASDDYMGLRQWVGELLAGSKEELGFGYTVTLEERTLRRYGSQSLPAGIAIETETDFLRLIGKVEEFALWQQAKAGTLDRFPQLRDWLAHNPQRLLPYVGIWDDLLAVCAYFVAYPRPNLYVRELPLAVHTKFIEENQAILRQLLDELLPAEAIDEDESHFERRYGLRYDEPQIRLRLLDDELRHTLGWPAADISLTLSECAALKGMRERMVFIVENKMTFLTLPPVRNGAAIWGKGFQVGLLRDIPWLAGCDIWYWGDVDAQGFAILSQLRGYWPHARSFLMDTGTLETYGAFVVAGTPAEEAALANLTGPEMGVYQRIVANGWRLEQERIAQEDVRRAVGGL